MPSKQQIRADIEELMSSILGRKYTDQSDLLLSHDNYEAVLRQIELDCAEHSVIRKFNVEDADTSFSSSKCSITHSYDIDANITLEHLYIELGPIAEMRRLLVACRHNVEMRRRLVACRHNVENRRIGVANVVQSIMEFGNKKHHYMAALMDVKVFIALQADGRFESVFDPVEYHSMIKFGYLGTMNGVHLYTDMFESPSSTFMESGELLLVKVHSPPLNDLVLPIEYVRQHNTLHVTKAYNFALDLPNTEIVAYKLDATD
jgi:hypothetical protein